MSESTHLIETSIPGIRVYPPPPASFSPLQASNEELSRFGFPSRPKASDHPSCMTIWKRFVDPVLQRIIPELEPSKTYHGRMTPGVREKISPGVEREASEDWSGIVLFDPANSFASPLTQITGNYRVPHGSCVGTNVPPIPIGVHLLINSSAWIGIDGAGSSDVLQCGTQTDVMCVNSDSHRAWVEWYPNNTTFINNLAVRTNDEMRLLIEVKSSNNADCHLTNATTSQTVVLNVQAPANTQLVGDTAEWVIEAPADKQGKRRALANYSALQMSDCAVVGKKLAWPGQIPQGTIVNFELMEQGLLRSKAEVPIGNPPSTINFTFVPKPKGT